MSMDTELERERMRLAACGVVAMADTPESAQKARDMKEEYRSASCEDVARRVDECMALRAERDALAAELKALREQEPVAFMHDQETRRDCVHIEVLDFLQRANSHYGFVNKIQRIPLDTTEHYTIPLYARPVPAEPVNARLLDVAVWPAGYCRDPNGKMSIPAGKEEDFNFGYDVGFQEAWEILNSAISAAGKSPTSQQERLLQDMHDAGREIDRVMAESAPKAPQVDFEAIARAIWNVRREGEDRCDMELEDLGTDHSVWEEASEVASILEDAGIEVAE